MVLTILALQIALALTAAAMATPEWCVLTARADREIPAKNATQANPGTHASKNPRAELFDAIAKNGVADIDI